MTTLESAKSRTLDMFEVSRKDAQAKMDLQIQIGARYASELINSITSMQIEDVLVPHNELLVGVNSEPKYMKLFIGDYGNGLQIHRHSLQQICSRTHFPIGYLDYLMTQELWGWVLGSRNLEELLCCTPFKRQDGKPCQFLLRSVGSTLRGFLSRRYGIHLSTNPLLPRFLDECKAKDALPVEVGLSDVRFHVKCALPYVYEVYKGQYLALGLSFHNSDFGAGKFSLRETIWDPIHGRGIIMGEPNASLIDRGLRDRVHLGPVLIEADLSPVGGTRAYRTELAAKHVKDTVQAMFSQEWIGELCATINKAQAMEISWAALVRRTGAVLLKEEVEHLRKMLIDGDPALPALEKDSDGLPLPTLFWGASAISELAKGTTDPERKIDLQEVAGSFLQKD